MREAPGIRAARERAEAFNAKIEAEQYVEKLGLDRSRAIAERNGAERKIKEMVQAHTAKYAPLAREQAARELGAYFAKKFIEKAEKDLGEKLAQYAYYVAEQALRSQDPVLFMCPPEIKQWFFTILDSAEHDLDVGVSYRNAPRRGEMVAAEAYVEHKLIWSRDVYAYRSVL
jgi:hypothetical protein